MDPASNPQPVSKSIEDGKRRYIFKYKTASGSEGEQKFDFAVVSTGLYSDPQMPAWAENPTGFNCVDTALPLGIYMLSLKHIHTLPLKEIQDGHRFHVPPLTD